MNITRSILLVLAGAAINCIIAWACVTWSDVELESVHEVSPAAAAFYASAPSCSGRDVRTIAQYTSTGVGMSQLLIDCKCYESGPCVSYSYSVASRGSMQAGWPFRALGGEVSVRGKRWSRRSCWASPVHAELPFLVNTHGWRDLPLRPVPLGFAANTLVYALLLYTAAALPLAAVRTWRRRQGRCVRCGYRTGEAQRCPECGSGSAQNKRDS